MFRILTLIVLVLGVSQGLFSQNIQWGQATSSTSPTTSRDIEIDGLGNMYITGHFEDSIDMDPTIGVQQLFSNGYRDVFIQKLDSAGNVLFNKSFGGPGGELLNDVELDDFGNIYMVGQFQDSIDLDPGPGVEMHVANSAFFSDFYVLKLNPSGDFQWAKTFGGSTHDRAYSIALTSNNDLIVSGTFSLTVDFDPNIGSYPMTTTGAGDEIYVLKLDALGNFLWAKQIESTGNNITHEGRQVRCDQYDNIYVGGRFSETCDFDPGAGVHNLTVFGGTDIYILKLTASGDFVWVEQKGGLGYESLFSLELDTFTNVHCAGNFQQTCDFDPSGGGNFITSNGSTDTYNMKLDSAGQLLWVVGKGSAGTDMPSQIAVDLDGAHYSTGFFYDSVDFSTDTSIVMLTSVGAQAIYLEKIDPQGNLEWAYAIGNAFTDVGHCITVDVDYNILLAGFGYGILDFGLTGAPYLIDCGSNQGGYFLAKYSPRCTSFSLGIDAITDITCSNTGTIDVVANGGIGPITYEWSTIPATFGSQLATDTLGFYEVVASDTSGCVVASQVYLDGPEPFVGFDNFVHLVSSGYSPGFPTTIDIVAFNNGCDPQSGDVRVVLDTALIFVSAIPPPTSISGDTLSWSFNGWIADTVHFTPSIAVSTPASVPLGYNVCLEALIEPSVGDIDTTNNTFQICRDVIGAYDPNDKTVFPAGVCDNNYVYRTDKLRYTIRFQNTGSDSAVNIHILDTLSANLDAYSFDLVATSHSPMYTELLPGNVLKFSFDSIMLPDSTANESESNGYLIFEIYPDSNVQVGAVVENSVGIFFDFNSPVNTNSVYNTLVDVIPNVSYSFSEVSCNPYQYDGTLYASSGSYVHSFLSTEGCDSIVTLDLTVISVGTAVTSNDPTLTANSALAAYQWLDCDDNYSIIIGETGQSFTATSNGNYAVEITENGCVDSSECVSITSFGMSEDFLFDEVSIYPNPSSGILNIDLENLVNVDLLVFSADGTTVFKEENIAGGNYKLILDVVPGIYLLELTSKGQNRQFTLVLK
jgi:uncharacterized repeat protein (TIGR01451 family)